MTPNESEIQPTVALENEYMEESSEDANPDAVKSGVRVDPNAALQRARFFKYDTVHMSQTINGARVKGIFQIYRTQYNSRGDFVEYQLTDALTGKVHKHGAWFREKDLRLERRG